MLFSRKWAIPSKDTFSIQPIGSLVKRYLAKAEISVDPFARNNEWAAYTNDLNPKTTAGHHLPAVEFLQMLKDRKIKADVVIFDPPYSIRQVKECYEGIGREFLQTDAQNGNWSKEKRLCAELLKPAGVFLHFGWHSNGIGLKHGFIVEEILLVAHGRCHYDTICTVERKIQSTFDFNE